eukprot:378292_1
MNDLKHVELFANNKTDIDINSFVTQNWINTNNVTTLCLRKFGTAENRFNPDIFLQLLTKFSHIEYCKFFRVSINNWIDANKLSIAWPKFKGLDAVTPNAQLLIDTFGNNLDFLGLFKFPHIDYNLSNIKLENLQELRIYFPTQKTLNDTLQTAVNINKIHLLFGISNPEPMKEPIIKVITTCKHLKYIVFTDTGRLFESILYGIEKGLLKTKQIKRKTMKIVIKIDSKTEFNPMEFISNIVNVINGLQTS